ncbi:MAG TPA: sugar phosphate isomerase/epimerase family protein [Ruminiclostridium sp.]
MKNVIEYIAASATGGDHKKPLDEVMSAYSKMGYKKFELYILGRGSAVEIEKGTQYYIDKAKQYGMQYSSLHLPPIDENFPESFEFAVKCALFAESIGVPVIVFNSAEKKYYVDALKHFLKAIDGHKIITLVQIHEGRSLENMQEVQDVLKEVNDPRVKVLHEVGSYHAIGVHWKKVIDSFGEKIGLVHLKDMVGRQSMPFGKGDIDLAALIESMDKIGYKGDYVVEMDPKDSENTHKYIGEAIVYLKNITE